MLVCFWFRKYAQHDSPSSPWRYQYRCLACDLMWTNQSQQYVRISNDFKDRSSSLETQPTRIKDTLNSMNEILWDDLWINDCVPFVFRANPSFAIKPILPKVSSCICFRNPSKMLPPLFLAREVSIFEKLSCMNQPINLGSSNSLKIIYNVFVKSNNFEFIRLW